MPAAEARRQAVLKFGTAEAVREDYHDERGCRSSKTSRPPLGQARARGNKLRCPS
jgi:hypothetical protein